MAKVRSTNHIDIDRWPTVVDGPDDGELICGPPYTNRIKLDGCDLLSRARERYLAKRDGFASADEMLDWFEKTHGLPFKGLLIKWGDAARGEGE